jgi:pimeloyl-ACP methyl ester carboxylesterase
VATLILVPGAWHGAWCWERVVPLTTAAGHRVLTPDLLGTGSDATPLTDVCLDAWARQIADLALAQEEPVILVGHSRAGIVISQAAERVPQCVKRLVFLAAGLVQNGDSLLEASNRLAPDFGLEMVAMHPDGTYTVNEGMIASRLYNKTDPEWSARAAARLRPDPTNVLTTKLALTPERFGRVPRAYIETADDATVLLSLQRQMQRSMPCSPVITLASDHCPFYSKPEALTEALVSIAHLDQERSGR